MVEEDMERMCGDPFPHLKRGGGRFHQRCTLPCVEPTGHHPETPHKCVDGHEWTVNAFRRGSRPPEQE